MLACDFSASPSADYNNSPSENVEFLISYQSSSDYTISLNKSSAKCGETIYLNIEMLSKGLAIEYVKANDEFCPPHFRQFLQLFLYKKKKKCSNHPFIKAKSTFNLDRLTNYQTCS